jgi:TolB protein
MSALASSAAKVAAFRSLSKVAAASPTQLGFVQRGATVLLGIGVFAWTAAAQWNAVPQASASMQRISVDWNGQEVTRDTWVNHLSSNGRFVTLNSLAALAANDLNSYCDAYLFDSLTGTSELISVNLAGQSGDDYSNGYFDVSDDGRFVAFISRATDLVPGGAPGVYPKCFVRDRMLGQTRLVAQDANGVPAFTYVDVALSDDGRFVAFSSFWGLILPDTNGLDDQFLFDLQTNTLERISNSYSGASANGGSGGGDVSRDGRFVTFNSTSSNLVLGDTNGFNDVFQHDRWSGQTVIVSVDSNGAQANDQVGWIQASADGRFVVFESPASNLVGGDTNGLWDCFLRDVVVGSTERVSISSAGVQGDQISFAPAISPDGRFVAFVSAATNLVPGDTNGVRDVFLRDLATGFTSRVSMSVNGVESDGHCFGTALSTEARTIAFQSIGSTLVPNDTNGVWDAFVRRSPVPVTYCTAKVNSLGCVPAIASMGVPTVSSPQGFLVSASNVLNQKAGFLLYSTNGGASTPFGGGTLCVRHPVRRTPSQQSGGSTSGVDCTGTLAFDFDAWVATGSDPALVAGRGVWAQYWSRDPGFAPPNNCSLTEGLWFELGP